MEWGELKRLGGDRPCRCLGLTIMANPSQRLRSNGSKSGARVAGEPLDHLIQHIKQEDPKLYEALKRLYNMVVGGQLDLRALEKEDVIEKPPAPPDFEPPDVTVDHFLVGGRIVSHNTAAMFSGKIHFPTLDADYADYFHHVEAIFEFPDGEGIHIFRWMKPTPPAVTTDFTDVWHDRILLGPDPVPNCKLIFYAVGPDGTYGPNPPIMAFTLPALGMTSVIATESVSDRWQDDPDRNVHSVVAATVTRVAPVPFYVTAWTEHPPDSVMPELLWHGWLPVDDVRIGVEGSNTNLFTPLKNETWTLVLEVGTIDSNVPPSSLALRSRIKRTE